MREREAFSPRDSILNATRNREKLSLQSRFYTPPPRLNEKVGFIIPTTRTRTFSMSARRFSEVGAVQFRRRVGIGILLGWLGV